MKHQTLEDSVYAALVARGQPDADQGTAALALTYARTIDSGGDLDRLGPQLLTVLDALLLTPKARAAVMKGGKPDALKSPLDALRARRSARQRDAETVDPTASRANA